jgi:membrane protease YdiL (CAAX protease family)
MRPASLDVLLFSALFTLLLASLIGVLWAWVWALRRLYLGLPILSDAKVEPARRVPWGGGTVLLTILLYLVVSHSVVRTYEAATGRHLPRQEEEGEKPALPGIGQPAPPVQVVKGDQPPRRIEPQAAPADDRTTQTQGELMLQSAIINLLLLVLVPALVFRIAGATPADLGWQPRGWPSQVFEGVRAAMLMTPVVFAIQSLAVRIWPSQKHPLEQMVLEQFTPGVAVLAVVSAMFLAPFVEELLFRGVLQQWFSKQALKRVGGDPVSPDSETELPLGSSSWVAGDSEASPSVAHADLPSEATPAESAGLVLSILMTSFLFAVMHYAQWPAPIAIFFLSLWLGTVYQRTGSLITAVALHGTFNGFSTVMLLLQALSHRLAHGAAAAMISWIASPWS